MGVVDGICHLVQLSMVPGQVLGRLMLLYAESVTVRPSLQIMSHNPEKTIFSLFIKTVKYE